LSFVNRGAVLRPVGISPTFFEEHLVIAAIRIGDSVQQGLDALFLFIPNLVGALIILLVGFIIAKLVKAAMNKVLEKTKVDETLTKSDAGRYVEKVSPDSKPSHLIGFVAFWFIFLSRSPPRSAR